MIESKRAVEERERLLAQLKTAVESRDEFISIASPTNSRRHYTSLKMQIELTQRAIKPEQLLGPTSSKLAQGYEYLFQASGPSNRSGQ